MSDSKRRAASWQRVGALQRRGLELDPKTSARMGRIRQRDTKPEMAVRQLMSALGLRYRTRNRDLPGSPDIANRCRRWVTFVHGCYWHGHPGCRLATIPKRNREFWLAKFANNRVRDARAIRALRRSGFRVITIWQCELEYPERVSRRLERLLLGASRLGRPPPRLR
jgi:DNA mismatch endonuclease (patch repair protein)